jgi:hypothetical protein
MKAANGGVATGTSPRGLPPRYTRKHRTRHMGLAAQPTARNMSHVDPLGPSQAVVRRNVPA